jgi:murein DD-endopeptidase MepM/ murein hydrolase activator NlpD
MLIFFGILVGIFTYKPLVEKAYESISLKEENNTLKQQVEKLNELSEEVSNLKYFGDRIQSTLKGYVNISETQVEDNFEDEIDPQSKEKIVSIFNTIPLKAPVIGFISQEYKSPLHNGIDIVASEGTPILAAATGTVLYSDWNQDGGYTIIIGYYNGYYTHYKHNLRNIVQNNEQIEQGQVIAYLGNSGRKSYGPHLHFEIWKDGKSLDPKELIMEYK